LLDERHAFGARAAAVLAIGILDTVYAPPTLRGT
jgi:hypothetical protein